MKKFEICTKETVYSKWTYWAESLEDVEGLQGEFGPKIGDDFYDDVVVTHIEEVEQ